MASSVDDLSLKDLRGLIKEAGLSSDGCIDKADLRERAKEALERLEVPGAALGPISKTLIVPQAPPAASESFISLLGEELLTKDGLKSTMALLAGKKFVMLYFSAHWCPPCKQYTPELAKAYIDSQKKTEVEIVFVSGDRDMGSFNGYFDEMPWAAVPFSPEKNSTLSSKYGVTGIPSLVLLDGNANLVNNNIRGAHGQYL